MPTLAITLTLTLTHTHTLLATKLWRGYTSYYYASAKPYRLRASSNANASSSSNGSECAYFGERLVCGINTGQLRDVDARRQCGLRYPLPGPRIIAISGQILQLQTWLNRNVHSFRVMHIQTIDTHIYRNYDIYPCVFRLGTRTKYISREGRET